MRGYHLFVKKIVLALLGLNILVNSVFNSFNVINSDTVWSYLLLPHFFKDMVYLASDTFILHYPISFLLIKFIGLNSTLVFVDTFVLVVLTLVGWLAFYFYFLKKYISVIKLIYILPAFIFINFSQTFYQMISIPSLRNIEFAIALLLLIYFDNLLLLNRRILLKLGVFLIMLLLFISDPYFIYVFAAPLLLIMLIRARKNLRYWNVIGLLFTTIVANTAIRSLLNKTQHFLLHGVNNGHIVFPSKIASNIDLTIKGILNIFDSYPNLHLLSFLSLSLFLLGVYGLYIMFKKGLGDKKNIALLLLPLCFVFTILAYLTSGQPTDLATSRYLIFIVFLLPFGVCYAISKFSSKYARTTIILVLTILSLANFIQMYFVFKSANNSQQYEENQLIIKTVQQYGVRYGYTSYWNSGINTFMSGNVSQFIQVGCINNRIQPHKWLASESWFDKNTHKGKTFLLIDFEGSRTPELKGCDLKDVTEQFGKPAQIVPIPYAGENISLVIFNYNIAEEF